MNPPFLKHILFVLSLCLFSSNSIAAQWYHVELIVFENLNSISDEKWPVMDVKRGKLSLGGGSKIVRSANISTLMEVASRLNKSSQYRVYYHRAWKQPIMRKGREKSIDLVAGNNKISGSIKLYKSTYLHAELDIWLTENTVQFDGEFVASQEGSNIGRLRNPNLKETRRIRSEKLYFFDHPKLGAILKLTPI